MPQTHYVQEAITASFADILGHDASKHHLMSALRDGHLSHAYIIEGPPGIGKHMLAHAFIRALFCENPRILEKGREEPGVPLYEACGACPSCKKLSHANHPDVKVIGLKEDDGKKARSISKAQIREGLVDDMALYPYESRYKVYLVEDADRMTPEAQNALLKTLEEPPAYGMVLLLGSSLQAFLPTILSRCVKLSLTPVDNALVAKALSARGLSAKEAEEAALFAGGAIGRGLMLMEDQDFQELREAIFDFFGSLPKKTSFQILESADLFSGKERFEDCLSLSLLFLRDALAYQATKREDQIYLKGYLPELRAVASHYSQKALARIFQGFLTTRRYLGANVTEKLALDALLINFLTE